MTDSNRFGRTPKESEELRVRVADMQRRYLAGELKDRSAELESKARAQRLKLRAARESI